MDVFHINTLLDETVRKAMAYKKEGWISEVLIHQNKFTRQVQCNMTSGTNLNPSQIRTVKQHEDWCCWKISSVDPWNSSHIPRG